MQKRYTKPCNLTNNGVSVATTLPEVIQMLGKMVVDLVGMQEAGVTLEEGVLVTHDRNVAKRFGLRLDQQHGYDIGGEG